MRLQRYNQITFLVLLLVFVLMLFSALAGSKLICDYCKRNITNPNYVWVGDKYFHDDHFFCAECKKSLVDNKFYNEDGKYYCLNCYDKKFVLKCHHCGESINSRYFEIDEKIYHKKCYDKYLAPRCNLCLKIIDDEFLTDFWGNKYHSFHKDDYPACEYCSRFISEDISKGGFVYDDGRHICGICEKNSVDNIREAEKLMAFISQKLQKFGIKIEIKEIRLLLVDRKILTRLGPDRNADYAGLTKFNETLKSDKVVSAEIVIYILDGMPRDNFRATMAHELMHVWLYNNSPKEMDPALKEGSCNYVSYLLLQNDRADHVAWILDNLDKDPNIFYGEGYRRIKKLARRIGIEEWLKYLKKNKNFPSGF